MASAFDRLVKDKDIPNCLSAAKEIQGRNYQMLPELYNSSLYCNLSVQLIKLDLYISIYTYLFDTNAI